jgi:transcriptional regulator with GAF, ATPase, and Fis domain
VGDSDSDQGRLANLRSEILHAVAVDVVGRALSFILLTALAVVGLLVWRGGSLPAWTVLLVVVIAAATMTWQARVGAALRRELGRHNEYSRHLQNSLDALQRVISGDVDAEIPFFLEQAVLEPAQRILSEKPAEKVRLAVLLPDDDNPDLWSMRWSAGHSMIGKLKFAEPIATTLSRHAFESGEAQYWADVAEQTEFRQNPHASAPTHSLVSIPIREGDEVLGVFNAISSEKEAFDDAEQTFLASLAGVLAVAVSVWHQGQEDAEDSDRDQH